MNFTIQKLIYSGIQVCDMEEEIDVTKLKYVLYARKSTDDPEKQGRSVEDQIAQGQKIR